MKRRLWFSTSILTAALILPAAADVIYSGLQDLSIPYNLTGVTVTIDGGTLNAAFGGVAVYNNDLLQTVRATTVGNSAIQNLAVGAVIDLSKTYATGYGVSTTHLGNTFTSGQEGYIGFKVNGTEFGWARVVFATDGSAKIKDWAYDTSGAINVGRIEQSAAVSLAQTVTFSPGTGESFTLGSQITDVGLNINSVIKTAAGKTILNATNTYTGTTTISAGVLGINGNQSAATGSVSVSGAGTRLIGTGTIGGDTTIGSGAIQSAGGAIANVDKVGIQTFDKAAEATTNLSYTAGSIFEWDINENTNIQNVTTPVFDQIVGSGTLTVDGTAETGTIFRVILGGTVNAEDAFWNTPFATHTWDNIFTGFASVAGSFNNSNLQVVGSSLSGIGSFSISGTSLTWTAVPEPTSALVGLLITAGLLRRRRVA